MDLSTLDVSTKANQGATVEIYHPITRLPLTTEDGKKVTVTVLGRYSDVYVKNQRRATNRRLQQAGRGRGGIKVNAEELEAEAVELLSNCITAWENVTVDGQVLECNQNNAKKILSDPRFAWFRDQVDEAVNDDSNFMSK